jgi:hypothetical protein
VAAAPSLSPGPISRSRREPKARPVQALRGPASGSGWQPGPAVTRTWPGGAHWPQTRTLPVSPSPNSHGPILPGAGRGTQWHYPGPGKAGGPGRLRTRRARLTRSRREQPQSAGRRSVTVAGGNLAMIMMTDRPGLRTKVRPAGGPQAAQLPVRRYGHGHCDAGGVTVPPSGEPPSLRRSVPGPGRARPSPPESESM